MFLRNVSREGLRIRKVVVVLLITSFILPAPITIMAEEIVEDTIQQNDGTQNPLTDPIPTPSDDNENETNTEETSEEQIIDDTEQTDTDDQGDDPILNTETEEDFRDSSRDIVKTHKIEPDTMTGAMHFEFPFVVPPGRSNFTPDFHLTYSNQTNDNANLYGYGWSDSLPYIERMNKRGTDKLYTENFFYSSFDGELKANDASTSTESYGARIENGNFFKYEYKNNNKWLVTDKTGTTYKFGYSTSSQQFDPSNTARISRWMIEEVRDRNNNYIRYEYTKDSNQIYPSKIYYTGNDATDGIFEIEILKEARTDHATSSRSQYEVVSKYRINEIRAKVNGTWVRKYVLGYTTGSNGVRSLLYSITESGQDESSNVLTLPITVFQYQSDAGTEGFDGGTSGAIPEAFVSPAGGDLGTRFMNLNSDVFPDIATAREWTTGGGVYIKSYTNAATTTGWTYNPSFDSPYVFIYNQRPVGIELSDVNGDFLTDILRRPNNNNNYDDARLNNGSGWTTNLAWIPPVPLSNLTGGDIVGSDQGSRYVDVNADGLTDVVYSRVLSNYSTSTGTFINNGNGWTEDGLWTSPEPFIEFNGSDRGVRFADLNGDSLVDIIKARDLSTSGSNKVYINTGYGWASSTTWSLPSNFEFSDVNGSDRGVRLVDGNGDGLQDMLMGYNDDFPSSTYFYKNTGFGWFRDTDWDFLFTLTTEDEYRDKGIRIIDINGDGMEDLPERQTDGTNHVHLNQSKRVDLLTGISLSSGASTTISYKASALYKTATSTLNPDLPLNFDTVESVVINDGRGNTATTTYFYEGGDYYWASTTERKMAGFHSITKTDSAGNTTKTYYYQGNASDSSLGENSDSFSKIGKPFRVEVADSSGNIYQKTINKWETATLANGREFVKLTQKTDLTYDGDSDHKDRVEAYTYDDATGNLTQKITWGEVTGSNDGSYTDTGTDKFTTTISYAASTSPYILGLPSQETLLNQASTTVRETKNYYDLLSHGNVDKGNLTKQEMWRVGTSTIDIEKTYNSYGLVTQEKDPRDKITSFAYDTYNLYIASSTNPVSHVVEYEYDYSIGKPKEVTDPNSYVFQTIYDALDRVKEEKQPDQTTPSTLVTRATYTYTDTGMPRKVVKTEYLDSTNGVETHTYLDGLQRVIQDRKEAEAGNYATRDFAYNNLGLIQKESLPYFSSSTAQTTATTTAALYTTYTYDPLYRVLTLGTATGNITNSYDDWKQTITDQRSKVKNLYRDAYNNLVQVDEHDGANTYSTYYIYNGLGNLTKITDALGNVRNFTYDGLGRRLTAEDLHASADTTFGTWTYEYDNSGNISQKTDPKGQVVTFAYDNINRPLTENYTGQAGTELEYLYDTCSNGMTKLCIATSTGAVSTYTYSPLGQNKTEIRRINSTNYTTEFTHDRQGNVLTIHYPDGTYVEYEYNNAGLVEEVHVKGSTASEYVDLIDEIDYSPLGQITYQHFRRDTYTINTYDQSELYRLRNKSTWLGLTQEEPGGGGEEEENLMQNFFENLLDGGGMEEEPAIVAHKKIQDMTYTYDTVGNITKIVDVADTATKKTVDYTYDDLSRLTVASSTLSVSPYANYRQTYAYSPVGNISYKSDVGSYLYTGHTGGSTANPHAATDIASSTLSYDDNGNLTSYLGTTYTWDYNNRMLAASTTATTTSYIYDHTGMRVKNANGTTTTYTVNKYFEKTGTVPTEYLYLGNQLIGTVTNTGASADLKYVHTDHLGSIQVVTAVTDTIKEVTDPYPFGSVRFDVQNGFNSRKKYTGKEYDADTGLSYLNARYYGGSHGQFLSQDPVFRAIGNPGEIKNLTKVEQDKILMDPQAVNSYSYARNNPIRYSDPEGLWFKEVITRQQSFSDFQVEIGQATQFMTDNNSTWNYAVSNPWEAGAVTGLVGGAAFLTGVPAAAAFSSSLVTVSGVGKAVVVNRLVEGSIYTYLSADALGNLSSKLEKASSVKQKDIKSYTNFAGSFALDYGPGSLGEKADAVGNIVQLTQTLVSKLSDLVKQQPKEQKGIKINNNKK
jgi:RHS repeat-associated protein